MRCVIITRTKWDSADRLWEITHPRIKEYANKCRADFLVLDENSRFVKWLRDRCRLSPKAAAMYSVFITKELLKTYDRVMNLDTDILIRSDCPNLFEIVPEDVFGCVYTDVPSKLHLRVPEMLAIQHQFGWLNWTHDYFNGGMWIAGKIHQSLFEPIGNRFWIGQYLEQTHLNYQVKRLGFRVCPLSFRFNHIPPFSEPWNGGHNRFDSYIIHYQGEGCFPDKGKRTLRQIVEDDARVFP